MDATQKKQLAKVTLGHFLLTIFCIFAPALIDTSIRWSGPHGEAYNRALQHQATNMAWTNFITDVALLLQPQFWLVTKVFTIEMGVVVILLWLTIPLWSYCFGWLFVKLDNWLNHFPVLGRRVF